MHQLPLLFSFDLLSLAFLPHFDPLHHILLEQPTLATFKVLKNAQQLKALFRLFEQSELLPVCYSSKSFKQTAPVMSSINPALKWAYVHVDNKKLPFVRPNHARLSKVNDTLVIEYGQGFSACEGKQQLRIAISSAIKLGLEEARQKFIIFEGNAQEIAKLKQQGFKNIFSIPDEQALIDLEAQFSRIFKDQVPVNKQFIDFVSNANTLDEGSCGKISTFHYFQNRKNICPTVSLGSTNNVPIYRLPKSTSVCAMVFRYAGDKQLYIGKADLTSKIGGDLEHELQQDKILQSCLHQTLTQIANYENEVRLDKFLCLPMFLSHFTMKNCLVRAYNKNKAHFVVKPYFNNIKKMSEALTLGKQQQQIFELVKSGKYNGQPVSGFGNLLGLSILFNEQFEQKGFLETVGFLPLGRKSLQGKSQKRLQLYRMQFTSCSKKMKLQTMDQLQIKLLSFPEVTIKVSQLFSQFLQEFIDTVALICGSLPILESVFMSQIWNFSKKQQLSRFVQTTIHYAKIFKILHPDSNLDMKKQLSKMDIPKIHPKLLNYLVASAEDENFQYFTNSSQQTGVYEYELDRRNPYQQQITGLSNFIIFGQCIPALSFVKWVKSVNRNSQIIYLSLLLHRIEEYVKQVKMAKASKKNILFIVDHCEIQQMGEQVPEHKLLVNTNWGLRTIFMYRMKFGSSKNLAVVHDPLTAGKNNYSAVYSKLPESHQQIFKTIFRYARNDLSQNAFEIYRQAIWLYVKNKWISLGIKAGISDLSQIMEKLKMLVKAISLKNNRLVSILKWKEFNGQPPMTMGEESMGSTNELNQPDSSTSENISSLQHLKDVPRAQIFLYCLPIFVSNQRVWLLHDIHQYLSAYYLQDEIIRDTWEGILQGEQLQNFLKWFDLMKNKKEIRESLVRMIEKFENERVKFSGRPQIMGANNSLNDCLELLKKIGAEQLFCKLDNIFYMDSPVVHMQMIQPQRFIAITQRCGIYEMRSEVEKQQEVWKMKVLHQEQTLEKDTTTCYTFIGIHSLQAGQKVEVAFALFNKKSNSFVISEEVLQIKFISIKATEIETNILSVRLLNLPPTKSLVKIILLGGKVGLFIFQQGNLMIMNLSQQGGKKLFKAGENDDKCVLQLGKGRKIKLNPENLKFQYNTVQDGSIRVMIGYLNQDANQQSSRNKEIIVTQLKISEANNGQKLQGQISTELSLLCQNQIKSIGVGLGGKKGETFQILAFEQITDALMIWSLGGNQEQKMGSRSKPDRKLYRIENDPVGVYKYGDILYVASKYSFIKRMVTSSA